jgi:hypothetical protein
MQLEALMSSGGPEKDKASHESFFFPRKTQGAANTFRLLICLGTLKSRIWYASRMLPRKDALFASAHVSDFFVQSRQLSGAAHPEHLCLGRQTTQYSSLFVCCFRDEVICYIPFL